MKKLATKAKEKNILSIKGLCFTTFRNVLDSIDWEIFEGERWVMLGANGAGKTSLISTICAYNTPSSGEMSICGKTYSLYDWRKVRGKIALVGTSLDRATRPSETVLEVVAGGKFAMINFFGRITKKLASEALRNLKKSGIEKIALDSWEYISQGERQKALIARALMVKPNIVLLDEPCSGLDPVARNEFRRFLDKLSADKKIPAIILATHHVEEIPPSFKNAILIKDGKVLASGKIDKVVNSKNLSELYGAKCEIKKTKGFYELKVKS